MYGGRIASYLCHPSDRRMTVDSLRGPTRIPKKEESITSYLPHNHRFLSFAGEQSGTWYSCHPLQETHVGQHRKTNYFTWPICGLPVLQQAFLHKTPHTLTLTFALTLTLGRPMNLAEKKMRNFCFWQKKSGVLVFFFVIMSTDCDPHLVSIFSCQSPYHDTVSKSVLRTLPFFPCPAYRVPRRWWILINILRIELYDYIYSV